MENLVPVSPTRFGRKIYTRNRYPVAEGKGCIYPDGQVTSEERTISHRSHNSVGNRAEIHARHPLEVFDVFLSAERKSFFDENHDSLI